MSKRQGNHMVPEDELDHVNFLVRDYLTNKGVVDEAEKKMKAAKEELIQMAGDCKRVITDQWVVPVVDSSNSGYDWAAMPQELKDELLKYKTTTPYSYLRGIERQD